MQVFIIAAAALALSAAVTAADGPKRYYVGDVEVIEGSRTPLSPEARGPFSCRQTIPSLTECGEGLAPSPAPSAVTVVSSVPRPVGGSYWRRSWTRPAARSAPRPRARIAAANARR